MRRRILLLVVGMTVLVVLAFAVPLTVLIRSNVRSNAISELQRDASDVARSISQYGTSSRLTAYLDGLENTVSVQDAATGKVAGTLPPGGLGSLPALPTFTDRDGGRGGGRPPDPTPTAYADGTLIQLRVRIFDSSPPSSTPSDPSSAPSSSSDNGYVVRVYATDDAIMSGQTRPLLFLAGASVGLLLLGIALSELLTRRVVRPLVHTAETAQRLAAGDVTARATTSGPAEVADVGRALNRLADRIDQLIADERETVADLSHRLRTPMTALRLDAEALVDPVEAERLGSHVTALERLLTAVIRSARRPQREGRLPSSDASEVVGDRVEFWSALAEDQNRAVDVALPTGPLPVRAGAEDLAAAVDALLENVFAHTPEGVAFAVRLGATPDGAVLEVGDDGPGLPEDAHVRGRSDRGSSGLGLDIARRTAEAAGGAMTLGRRPSGGALVTLTLRAVD